MLRGLAVLATAALAAVGGTVTPQRAAAGAQRCLIAFDRNDAGTNLAVYDTGSGRVRDVTYGAGDDSTPAWSPDGSRLVFARTNAANGGVDSVHSHIWVTDLDGNERQLTTGSADDFGPVWSPDARRVAFSRAGGLLVVNVATRHVARLASLGQTGSYLSWSPDGRKLAYETLQGIKAFDFARARSTLVIRHASNPQYLRDGRLAYRVGNTFHAGARSLTISFAGRGQWNAAASSLVFASLVDDQLTSPPPAQLYVERAGAPHPRHLFVSHFAGSPSWRPAC